MAESQDHRRRLGTRGEARAAGWLSARGMTIVERNFRCRRGEIDLVAEEGGTVVFVEVKGKGSTVFGRPEEMVTAAKRRRLTSLALLYLQRRKWLGRRARFDVVAVDWDRAGEGAVRHIRGAFDAEGGW